MEDAAAAPVSDAAAVSKEEAAAAVSNELSVFFAVAPPEVADAAAESEAILRQLDEVFENRRVGSYCLAGHATVEQQPSWPSGRSPRPIQNSASNSSSQIVVLTSRRVTHLARLRSNANAEKLCEDVPDNFLFATADLRE